MKFLVIVNPKSGKQKALYILEKIRPIFESNGISLLIVKTKYQGNAKQRLQTMDLSTINSILVLGGDGTLNEVVNGMLNRNDNIKLPIGVIPVGSGNSFSSDLKMFDPIQAAKKISLLNTEHIDVLQLEMNHEMNFAINLVGWGLVKDVGARAEKLRLLGPIRYTFASIIEIFLSKGRKTELVVDGKKSIGMYTFIIGCNSIHVGNGMKMAPHAKLNDGLLDLVVVDGNISKFRLLSVMPQLFTGSHIKEKEVEYLQVKSFSIFSTEDEILNIDGELTGTTPIKVSVKEKEIEIFI
ncbi:MAG: diacylglycerol kinase family lipid kinase [SAR202 cluster bacterium]|nr:diacylglycerol kinase family lipid kinase [SAR202 cluster bacterium]